MKIITTVTVEVERTDGSSTRTTDRREYSCGDNPRFEAAEVAKALTATTRLASGAARLALAVHINPKEG